MQRNLSDVIDKMIEYIPKKHIIARLKAPQTSSKYAAPESQYLFWKETQDILIEELSNPDNLNGWQQKIVNIFTGKENEQTIRLTNSR